MAALYTRAGVKHVDCLACLRGRLPQISPTADKKTGGQVMPFSWAMDFLVPIFFPGHKYDHRAASDCYYSDTIIVAISYALMERYGIA
mgnify:FL=1